MWKEIGFQDCKIGRGVQARRNSIILLTCLDYYLVSNNNYHLLSNLSTWYCIEHEIYFTLFNSHRTKWGYFSFPLTCKETETHGVKLAKTKESDPSLPDYNVIMFFK